MLYLGYPLFASCFPSLLFLALLCAQEAAPMECNPPAPLSPGFQLRLANGRGPSRRSGVSERKSWGPRLHSWVTPLPPGKLFELLLGPVIIFLLLVPMTQKVATPPHHCQPLSTSTPPVSYPNTLQWGVSSLKSLCLNLLGDSVTQSLSSSNT